MDVVVGRIGRAHGTRGEVTVEVRTDDPEARFAPGSRLRTEPAEHGPLTVAGARPRPGGLIVAFAGVADRPAAHALCGTLLVLDAATLPPLDDPDEFYDHELVGLAAELPDGTALGRVHEVVHSPGGDLLVIRADPEPGPAHARPTEPARAAAPARPAAPAEPIGAATLAEPVWAAEPTQVAEPAHAARAAEPTQVADPAHAARAAEPAKPVEAAEPADPADPAEPARAVEPIEPAQPAGELLVPFVRAIVPTVDVSAGRVVIDPPPGLLEL